MVRILRVAGALPDLFRLAEAARAEGLNVINRVIGAWTDGGERFDGPGECLLAAIDEGQAVAIGGITQDPYLPTALRMRRFFTHPAWRHQGIARRMAEQIIGAAPSDVPIILRAGSANAAAFWERLGFVAEHGREHTHVLRR